VRWTIPSMRRVKRGSETGIDARFSSLFLSHYDDVLGYCVRRTNRADADDVAADVFATAWRRIDDLDWDTARPWLFGIARGTLANHHRSKVRRTRLGMKIGSLADQSMDGPEVVVIRREQDQEVMSVLESLREPDREILMLSVWENLTAAEIAVTLGISAAAAEQRLHRAKGRFAKELDRTTTQDSPRADGKGGER
jgi:RNA polymerase sigma-70 factor (ECF subfamily)